MSKDHPYRNISNKPLSPIKAGLIHTAGPHKCFLPRQSNWFGRLFLNEEKIKHGTLFRCACNKVYMYCEFDVKSIHNYHAILYPRWEESADAAWLAAGGEL